MTAPESRNLVGQLRFYWMEANLDKLPPEMTAAALPVLADQRRDPLCGRKQTSGYMNAPSAIKPGVNTFSEQVF
jgi:hypothetical protein